MAEQTTTNNSAAKSVASANRSTTIQDHIRSIFKTTSFYPAEYILMLLSSLSILVSISLLGVAILGQWFDSPASAFGEASVVYLVSSLLVTVPFHLALYWRVRHTDHTTLTALAERVSNAALGIYIFATVGTILSLTTWLLYGLLQAALGTSKDAEQLLASSLMFLQAIAWFKYATWHFLRLRTADSRPKYYALFLGLTSIVIIGLALVFPGSVARAAAADAVKEADLIEIETAIASYTESHSELPAGLDQLDDLDRDVAQRIDDYTYRPKGDQHGVFNYEICANFARRAGTGEDIGFGYTSHDKGRQCFERTVSNYGSYPLDDYPFDGANGSLQDYVQPAIETAQ